MNNNERTELRNLQDKVINHMLQRGYNLDHQTDLTDINTSSYLTLRHFKLYIYPKLKFYFDDYIRDWNL